MTDSETDNIFFGRWCRGGPRSDELSLYQTDHQFCFGDYWLNSDDSTGNNDIVGDNEGPTAVMYYQLPPGIESFMIQMYFTGVAQ